MAVLQDGPIIINHLFGLLERAQPQQLVVEVATNELLVAVLVGVNHHLIIIILDTFHHLHQTLHSLVAVNKDVVAPFLNVNHQRQINFLALHRLQEIVGLYGAVLCHTEIMIGTHLQPCLLGKSVVAMECRVDVFVALCCFYKHEAQAVGGKLPDAGFFYGV